MVHSWQGPSWSKCPVLIKSSVQELFYDVFFRSIGITGIDDCPFRDHTIVGYLIAGGVVLGIIVCSRTLPSVMTCCKNKNYFGTKNSSQCAGSILACECIFCVLFILNIILLLVGTYWVFEERPSSSCDDDDDDCEDSDNFCKTRIYAASVIYVILQYVLHVFSAFFLCLVATCHRCLKVDWFRTLPNMM